MSIWIVVAQGLLGAGVLIAIAYPLLGRVGDGAHTLGEASDKEAAREALLAEKHLAYEALKELEFDRVSGKLSEDDYQAMHRELEAEAIRLLKKLDALEGQEASDRPAAAHVCPSCGRGAKPGHTFCPGCGSKLQLG